MKHSIDYFAAFLAVVIISVFAWFLFSYFSLETLFASGGGILSLLVLLHNQSRKETSKRRDWLLKDKQAYLCEMADLFFTVFHKLQSGQKYLSREMTKKFRPIQPAFLVWASPKFIRAWNDFRSAASKNQITSQSAIKITERLFRAIREECGHNDSSLKPGEVLAFFMAIEEKENVLRTCRKEKYE